MNQIKGPITAVIPQVIPTPTGQIILPMMNVPMPKVSPTGKTQQTMMQTMMQTMVTLDESMKQTERRSREAANEIIRAADEIRREAANGANEAANEIIRAADEIRREAANGANEAANEIIRAADEIRREAANGANEIRRAGTEEQINRMEEIRRILIPERGDEIEEEMPTTGEGIIRKEVGERLDDEKMRVLIGRIRKNVSTYKNKYKEETHPEKQGEIRAMSANLAMLREIQKERSRIRKGQAIVA